MNALISSLTKDQAAEYVELCTGAPVSPSCTLEQLQAQIAKLAEHAAPSATIKHQVLSFLTGSDTPAPKAETKYDKLRRLLREGNKTLQDLIDGSGFDAKNVRVSISILRHRFGMAVQYDAANKLYGVSSQAEGLISVAA